MVNNYLKNHVVLEQAKTILDNNEYQFFEKLITDYDVEYKTPYWDMCCLLMLKKVKKKRREDWLKFWVETSERVIKHNESSFMIPNSYLPLEQLSLEKLQNYFIPVLERSKGGNKLKWENHIEMIYSIIHDIKPIFSKNEFLLFKTIIEHQIYDTKVLSAKLNFSSSNVSKYKKRLYYNIFRGFTFFPKRLNLHGYIFFINSDLQSVNILSHINTSTPYLRRTYESTIGDKNIQLAFLIPNESKAIKDLKDLKRRIEEKDGVNKVRALKVSYDDFLVSYNYSSYNYRAGRWEFYPQLLQYLIETKFYSSEAKDDNIIHYHSKQTEEKVILNERRKKLFNSLLTQDIRSLRKISESLDISLRSIKRDINYLKKRSVIMERYAPYSTFGLISIAFLLNIKRERHKNIHCFFARFPEVFSYYCNDIILKKEYLYYIIRTPREDLLKSLNIIKRLFSKELVFLTVIERMYKTRQGLPFERYDSLYNKWEYTEGEIIA